MRGDMKKAAFLEEGEKRLFAFSALTGETAFLKQTDQMAADAAQLPERAVLERVQHAIEYQIPHTLLYPPGNAMSLLYRRNAFCQALREKK